VSPAPYPSFVDVIFLAGQATTSQTAKAFVEGHVNSVEQSSDSRGRALVIRSAFPEARTVQVDSSAFRPHERDLLLKIAPGWKAPPDLPLRKFKENGGQAFAHFEQVG
jgi:GDP-D-mannose dehydratase